MRVKFMTGILLVTGIAIAGTVAGPAYAVQDYENYVRALSAPSYGQKYVSSTGESMDADGTGGTESADGFVNDPGVPQSTEDPFAGEVNAAPAGASASRSQMESATFSTQATDNYSPLASSWKDNAGRKVVLREDVRAKVAEIHNVSEKVVRRATQYPDRVAISGTSYVYRTTFIRVERGRTTGREVVRTVVDFRMNYMGRNEQKGVVTSYCENKQFCPNWVRQVL